MRPTIGQNSPTSMFALLLLAVAGQSEAPAAPTTAGASRATPSQDPD